MAVAEVEVRTKSTVFTRDFKKAVVSTLAACATAGLLGVGGGAWAASRAWSDVGHSIKDAQQTGTQALEAAKSLEQSLKSASERIARTEAAIDVLRATEVERYQAILRKLDDMTAELRALREKNR